MKISEITVRDVATASPDETVLAAARRLSEKALGTLIVDYAPSDRYLRKPDRASAYALEGQRIIGGILRPGAARKFLPGRYRIEGWQYAGDIAPRETTIVAGETTRVTLELVGD